MAHGQFIVTSVNPNDTHGGGGCACDPMKQVDCKPPYVVCFANDMEDPRSPHVVICQACVGLMSKKLDGEVLAAGEKHVVTEPTSVAERYQREPPVVESPDPKRDFLDS